MKNLNFLKKLELGLQLERLVIGIEEPVLVKDLGEILAKIDSGNGGYNVIHGEDIIYQGNYISFLTYDGMGNPKRMSKKVVEELEIHIGGGIVQKRPVIQLDVKFANEDYKKILFSVTDRTDNSHKILISKDFVENTINALIDVGAKNISNMSYDVEYLPVNESDETGVSPTKLDANGKELKVGDKVNADGTKAGMIDKMTDKMRTLSGQDSQLKDVSKDKEVVEEWKPCAELFSNYNNFYNKDQSNIQKKISSASNLIQKLMTGDISSMIFDKKSKKVLSGNIKAIPIFGYNLKKGNNDGNGANGKVISGLEDLNKKWKDANKDVRVATIKVKNSEANYETVEELNDLQSESLIVNEENIINEVKSFDATNTVLDKSSKKDNPKSLSNDKINSIKEEVQTIKNLKGFIFYFIPFYNGNNSSALKNLNANILSGSFDDSMKQFIFGKDGSSEVGAEKIALSIKSFIEKDEMLLEQLPGVFALCYSQDPSSKNSQREVKFLSEKTVIVKELSDDDENNEENEIDVEKIKSQLEKDLNLPKDITDDENSVNQLISLVTSPSQNDGNLDINKIKEKLSEVNFPQPENPDDEKSINSLLQLIQNPSEKPSEEFNLDSIKNKLADLNLPQSENPEDEDSINSLISAISGAQNAEEIDMESIKTKLSQLGLPTSDSIKADNQKPGRVVTRIFKTLGIKNPAPKNQKVTNTDISEVTPQKEKTSNGKTSKATPVTK